MIILNILKAKYEQEKNIDIYKVDFLIDNSIILEVLGPRHFAFTEDSELINSKTIMKLMNLKTLGYSVKLLKFCDWN